jgi:hypothetical protein
MKKVFLAVCFGMGLLALTGMGEEPKCWNEWVNIKGAEDFVSAVREGNIVALYGGNYDKVKEKLQTILTSAQKEGPETHITAIWVLSRHLYTVDYSMSSGLANDLEQVIGHTPTNCEICRNLWNYYQKTKDKKALLLLSSLLENTPRRTDMWKDAVLMIQEIIPTMHSVGLGLRAPSIPLVDDRS